MYFNFFFLFLLFLIFLQKYMYSYGMVFFDRFYPNSDFNEYKKKYIINKLYNAIRIEKNEEWILCSICRNR